MTDERREALRERVGRLLERLDTAAFRAGIQECGHGRSVSRQDQLLEEVARYKAAILALLDEPEQPSVEPRVNPTMVGSSDEEVSAGGGEETEDLLQELWSYLSAAPHWEYCRCCGEKAAPQLYPHKDDCIYTKIVNRLRSEREGGDSSEYEARRVWNRDPDDLIAYAKELEAEIRRLVSEREGQAIGWRAWEKYMEDIISVPDSVRHSDPRYSLVERWVYRILQSPTGCPGSIPVATAILQELDAIAPIGSAPREEERWTLEEIDAALYNAHREWDARNMRSLSDLMVDRLKAMRVPPTEESEER